MQNLKQFYQLTIFVASFYITAQKGSDNRHDFLQKEDKRLKEKDGSCHLKKINLRNVDHLRIYGKDDIQAAVCIVQILKEKDFHDNGLLWTKLGTVYTKLGYKSQANTCFKHASKLTGKISNHISEWAFLGPFVIGKTEVDGDPVESFGGIRNASMSRFKKNVKFYSELASGGEVHWTYIKQPSSGKGINVGTSSVDWNDLVRSLGSLGITEWQGWLVGELAVNENGLDIKVQCLGVHTVFIDDQPVTGDVYHRERYWDGVNLDAGIHTVYVRLRTKVQGQLQCRFEVARNKFEILEPDVLPDLFDGHLFSSYITLPVANYHRSESLTISKVVLGDLTSKEGKILNNLDVRLDRKVRIASGQVYPIVLQIYSQLGDSHIISQCSEPESSWDIRFTLKFSTSFGQESISVSMRCRRARQSTIFTFLDHDGSVQHAATIQPLEDCPLEGRCPTLLSLHGTTISPQSQADSYKYMKQGDTDYTFGFQHAWTLTPTRHGAHNWEGPGLLTALSALDALAQLTANSTWLVNKADPNHVIYAGHSMGGHGAWHIATHYPDRALALVSLAGWIKKEEYGDSNFFFRHDIATSHVEPAVKAILEACIVENDADQHVSNLHGVAVVARIGARDRTVHPFFVRRMYRLLKEEGFSVSYTEVKDKEHWWWDTVETNDGGAVNDRYLRDFTNQHLDRYIQSEDGSCTQDGCQSTSGSDLYKARSGTSFRLVTYNPALGEGMYGIQILQQMSPFRWSEVLVNIDTDNIFITTKNVRVLNISQAPNRKIAWDKYKLKVDGVSLTSLDITDRRGVMLIRQEGEWMESKAEGLFSRTNRGPDTLGPARRIAEKPLKIVFGTSGSTQSYLQQAAVYISNLFFLTSNGRMDVVRDTDISLEELGNSNVIVIGNPSENVHTASFMQHIPITVESDIATVGSCRFGQARTGVLTLAPNGDSNLALLLMGTSEAGLQDIVSLASPTIPPMTRSPFSNLVPDFVITGAEFGRKGPGGYECAGFYGNSWEFRLDLASCVCN